MKLNTDLGLEITFLFVVTLWAFVIPLNGGSGIFDMAVFVSLYAVYIELIRRRTPLVK